MKPTLLSVKEVARELGVSTQSIRRAYWNGTIPAYRICKMLRFNFERVQRIFFSERVTGPRAARDRRREPPARPAESPRSVTRGQHGGVYANLPRVS